MDKYYVDLTIRQFIQLVTKGEIMDPDDSYNLTSFQMLNLVSQIENHFGILVEDRLIYRELTKSYTTLLNYVVDNINGNMFNENNT